MLLRRLLLFLSLLPNLLISYKFLVYNAQFGHSHAKFMGKLADSLVDAGHEVVVLSPIIWRGIGSGTKKARVIEVPQCEAALASEEWLAADSGALRSLWDDQSLYSQLQGFGAILSFFTAQCNATLHTPDLLASLRAEKFDAAFAEPACHCAYGIFHALGIEKTALTISMSAIDGGFAYRQVPVPLAYFPGTMSGLVSDRMTFFERLWNVIAYTASAHYNDGNMPMYDTVFQEFHPGMPKTEDLLAKSSLVFMNYEPFLDFPTMTTHRIVDIGGISISKTSTPLNETWSSLLNLRKHTVFMSFGTFMQAYLMPEEYRKTIVQTFKKFPEVTFIVKYEKPEDGFSQGAENIVEVPWAPQADLLNDPRLSAFITHGGIGSTLESAFAGVPLVVIPVGGDQMRNALAIQRNGRGIVVPKAQLTSEGPLEDAIREVIEGSKIRANAHRIMQILEDKPFKPNELFVRNMEFMARHGPFPQLQHYGKELNIFQYYLIDVFAFIMIIAIVVIVITATILAKAVRIVKGYCFTDIASYQQVSVNK